LKTKLSQRGPTARLWLQYFELVDLAKMFVYAERTGDFKLHLHCVWAMVPFFHAAGHYHYAKAAHMYVQRMLTECQQLSEFDREEFILNGKFAVKRKEKEWNGTWTDMCIEQEV
jgi:hypothetical protein